MTRTLFFLTALVAMLATLTALLIRAELAYPGVSPLFSTADGAPDGRHFNVVSTAHAIFAYLAVILLGTTMCAAARIKGAPLAILFVVLGVLASMAVSALLVLAELPAPVDINTGVGWVLYPPLSTTLPDNLLDYGMRWLDVDPLMYSDFTRVLILPAMAMLYLGAYAMLSTLPRFRWVGVLGALVVALTVTAMGPEIMQIDIPLGFMLFIAVLLPFIACASVRLIDDAPAWLLMLTVGALIIIAAQIGALSYPYGLYVNDTSAAVAATYTFPLGLTWFALPALMLFTHDTRLPAFAICACIGAISLGLALWLVPLFQMGVAGLPQRYVDYPETFAANNLAATAGVVIFALLYLAVVIVIRRNRA